jgi:hypothetical protein
MKIAQAGADLQSVPLVTIYMAHMAIERKNGQRLQPSRMKRHGLQIRASLHDEDCFASLAMTVS